jgi:MFS family permease
MRKMNDNPDLKQFEKMLYRSYHEDGLIDIFVGSWLITMTIGFVYDLFIIPAIYPALSIPMWRDAKNRITAPRTGLVKFGDLGSRGQNKMQLLVMIIIAVFSVAGLILIVTTGPPGAPEWLGDNFNLVMGAVGLTIFVAFASMSGIKRFYGYGLATLIIMAVGQFLGISWYVCTAPVGIIMVAYGLITLGVYMRDHPVASKEVPDA